MKDVATARSRAVRTLRASGERLSASIRELALRLRESARAESRRRRVVWGVIALLMVLGPVAFTLARESRFTASVEIFPRPEGPYPPAHDPGYYRSFLSDPELQREMHRNVRAGISEYRDATVRTFAPRGTLILTVAAYDPARARELVNGLGPQLIGASRRQVAMRAEQDAVGLRSQLRSTQLGRADRGSLRRQLRRVERLLPNPPDPAVQGPPAPKRRLERWADRVADAMPGDFPARPSPPAAGFAGLLIVVTLWAIGLGLVPPGRGWGRVPPGEGSARASGTALPAEASTGAPDTAFPAETSPEAAGMVSHPPARVRAISLPGWRSLIWIGVLVVAPLLTLSSIGANAVNLPFNDEWSLVSLFQADHNGTLNFSAFFAQHHEHRPLFPRSVDFGLAYVTGWDIRAELYLDFAVAVATFAGLLAALRRTLERHAFLIASVVTSVIFFSPVQWENWLWGWQLEWFLCNLMAVGAFWALTVLVDRSPGRGLRVGAVCAFVATFSLGQGLVLWPVGLALLVLRRRPWRTWAVLSVTTFVLYFAGWTNPGEHPSKTIFLERPVEFVKWVCLYFGRPFAVSTTTGVLVGAVLILSFAATAAYVVRHRRDAELIDRAGFWLALGLYVMGAALITAISRVGFGLLGAAVSRYSGMAGLFAIATMGLLFAVVRSEEVAGRAVTVPMRRWSMAVVAVPLLLTAIVSTRHGFNDMEQWREDKGAILACARQVKTPDDPCLNRGPLDGGRLDFNQIIFIRDKGWAGLSAPPGG